MQQHQPRSIAYYISSAVLALLFGTGVGHLVASLIEPSAAPVAALGSAVIDATPTAVKTWAISTFGAADKVVLIGSVLGIAVTAAAGVGALYRRNALLSWVGMALLSLFPFGAVVLNGENDTGLVMLIPLVTAVAGLGSFWVSTRRPVEKTGRRGVLALGIAVAGVGVVAYAVGESVARTAERVRDLVLPKPVKPLPPVHTGLSSDISGITPLYTPIDTFYRVDTSLVMPTIDPAEWVLDIDGDVDHAFSLTYDDVLQMPMIERDITMMCISNEVGGQYAGAARWLGVPVREVLARAGIRDNVDQIVSTDVDGMTISTPVQALTDDRDALLAVGMNGEVLPRKHGFPVRLVTPGLYGYVGSTKWLRRLTATTYAQKQAYWTVRGWVTDGYVLTQSRIDVPRQGAKLVAGQTMKIAGVAWAQGRGISTVEVSIGDGDWQPATFGPDAGIDMWRQWFVEWTPTPGEHRIRVRATDASGEIQTSDVALPFPAGATGWHSVTVRAE